MDRQKLEGLTREELVALAGELGVARPRSLTVPELIDEVVSRTMTSERDKARTRGWLGRARNLLAGVIERGLHLPDVAKALRNAPSTRPWPVAPPPLATMTLAEIYAAQGHFDKAFQVLDEILAREPDHADARSFRVRLEVQSGAKKAPETQPKREDVLTTNVSAAPADVQPSTVSDVAEQPSAVAFVAETNDTSTSTSEDALPAETVATASDDVPVADVAAEHVAAAPSEELTVTPVQVVADEAPEQIAAPEEQDPYDQAYSLEHEESPVAHEASSIEELPLPERYNVDEIVGIAVDPTTVYVYWEVRPVVLARAHARSSDGTMVVRLVSVTPTWDGPVTEQRDLRIDALVGDTYIRGLQPGSNVRISVGWLAHGDFTPFAIGESVVTPRKEPAFAKASTTPRWMPEGPPAGGTPGQTVDASLVTALERADQAQKQAAAARATSSGDKDPLGRRWPSFDLGTRGLPVEEPRRSSAGGSSDLVRRAQPTAG